MNIEFKGDYKKIVMDRKIVVAGKEIGEIEKRLDHNSSIRFHAVIRGFSGGLIQGHGPTEEEAVVDGISKARKEAIDRLEELENLQGDLMSTTAVAAA